MLIRLLRSDSRSSRFGTETLLVRSIPAMLSINEITPTLTELANALLSDKNGENLFEDALLTVVCHSAVRAGQTLSHEEMRDLIRQLERTALPPFLPSRAAHIPASEHRPPRARLWQAVSMDKNTNANHLPVAGPNQTTSKETTL